MLINDMLFSHVDTSALIPFLALSMIFYVHGYYPNGLKTKLLVQLGTIKQAKDLFKHTGIHTDGEKYLGGAIGNESFLKKFLQQTI